MGLKPQISGWIALLLVFVSCTKDIRSDVQWQNIEKKLQTELIMAADGDTIMLPAGHFSFRKALLLDGKKQLTIQGAGMDKTVLSFRDQTEGAEGLKISNCVDLLLMDFTIEDAKGDLIKVSETDGLHLSRIAAQWTGDPREENGAYAIYPVLCRNVLIEHCEAYGASDAVIYVGQSDTVIIRHCHAHGNVAGIESENSRWVDIHDNLCEDNTGGILVFDLPGLSQYGRHVRVFNNTIQGNNRKNFAPKGNIVGMVPPGTGIMVLATRAVEIFENSIQNNRTCGTAIVSYELVLAMSEPASGENDALSAARHNQNYLMDSLYNPFPDSIYIHDNLFQNQHWFPTLRHDIGLLILSKFPFNTPDLLYDGITDVQLQGPNPVCLDQPDSRIANLDAGNDMKGLTTDPAAFTCQGTPLNPVNPSFLSPSGQ
jgi:parallel beta-helix repeat protein